MKDEQWNSGDTPQVVPDTRFREDLYRALQETHRQQRALRQLSGSTAGGNAAAPHGRRVLTFAAALALLLVLFGVSYHLGRRHSAG